MNTKKKIIIAFLAKKLALHNHLKNHDSMDEICAIARLAEPVFGCGVPGKELPLIYPTPVYHPAAGHNVSSVSIMPTGRDVCVPFVSYVEFPDWFNCLDAKELWKAMPDSLKGKVAFMDFAGPIILITQCTFEGTSLWRVYWAFQLILSVVNQEERSKQVNLWGMGIDPLLKKLSCPEFVKN